MCAIAGMIGLEYNEDIFKKMLQTMRRRGPDGSGTYVNSMCALLHTRLAIIDPEGGRQPMELDWAGETYVITYNGELYNTAEVRESLRKLGHSFLGHSDTEVVLHAYAQWGAKALELFNGIFAFGVWEKQHRRLFLARDRMGVKPLFYKLHDSGLLFGSEIKTILTYPTVRAELDSIGIAEILLLGPGRTPGSGVFRGICELEPGWCCYYEEGKLHLWQYWSLKDRKHTDSFPETVEKVRELVCDAIQRQMVSDVPIGTFLSGGLDSSLISSVCARQMAERGELLDTFSVDYMDNDKYFTPGKFQPNADGQYIRIMESVLNTRHHWSVLTPEDLMDALEAATLARDLPGMADVDFSLLAFCGQIRSHVKVALSGECADEIFGGYPWYRDPEVRAVAGFPWAQNTKYRASFLHREHLLKLDPEEFVQQRYQQTISEADILSGTSPQERRMKEMVCLNQRWFMQTLLDRKDRMSMYHGLEVRVPFCDYRIAEYLYGVPWEYKDHNGFEKGLLRTAMEGLLPMEVQWRKKSPYPKTYDPRYLQIVSARLEEVLASGDAPILQIVKKEALRALLGAEYAWPWYGQLMKVPQTIAYMLQINYWLAAYNISVV
ncbi:MAG: asparagine synthase (glutamine-hydrolyzing) [Oscillospiraceae bacterium]|nr:asparagine synthase (glutamine-hydrolyzing) [Oscillospiraceae bacterium]